MKCNRAQRILDAWIDRELDEQTASALTAHVAGCATCATLKSERQNARDVVRELAPRYAAPSDLRQDVLRNLRPAAEPPAHVVSLRRAWSMALAGAAAGAFAMFLVVTLPLQDATLELAVASHVAALSSGSMVQVESGDRHTIKPWFQGKLDFAPPVRDLTAHGFQLLGARLDSIDSRPAAAVVYRIRNHPIDLYAWPGEVRELTPLQVTLHRGFGIAHWSGNGLHFAAVSDVDPRDLERFARLFHSP
jgi:anti-sigma factor RsiW